MDILENLNKITVQRATELNPLVLDFVGDSVFSLYVRSSLASIYDSKSGKLHLLANKFVSAKGQAKLFDKVSPEFNENELDIVRRARNQHTKTRARNCEIEDYKKSTCFEAVIGYLYLSGQEERLKEILSMVEIKKEDTKS